MAIDIHTLELADGSNQARSDRLFAGLQLSVANASGAAGVAVTTAVAFVAGALPVNYAVFVDSGQADVFATVSSKTITGFNVTLTPLSGAAVAAGSFNVFLVG
jgi:hypothetical protein